MKTNGIKKYDHKKTEKKWQGIWRKKKAHEPSFARAKKPFFNLMMFPYPSAEGLHVGNMYAFTGADIYGRFMRMNGCDVFEPIGLDGFGIHSENYALKTNTHPFVLSKRSEKNFYRQLALLGNSFAWSEKLETYDPQYYRMTQWLIREMFNRGLAYRKTAPVNWCPSCKTVLADEQVVGGKCERCDSVVETKELAQWFLRITAYAQELAADLETIDWSEKVLTAQRNWIGKSEGAEIDFELGTGEKPNFVLLHGYKASPEANFHPWLKGELESRGYSVQVPALPNPANPAVMDQVEYVLKHVRFDANTVLLGHSLGTVVAMKVAERLEVPLRKLVLVAGFIKPKFKDHPRSFEFSFDWKFDFKKIRRNVSNNIVLLRDMNDVAVAPERIEELSAALGAPITDVTPNASHVCAPEEPSTRAACLDSIRVFTTRPDTIFGATYLVLSPEHPTINNLEASIKNKEEVRRYAEAAKAKTSEERMHNKEKTGIELKGVYAINPATKRRIPVWVSDYVIGGVGTGAIMAVPAHDERDFEFAKKFGLPITMVICPNYPEPKCPPLDAAYTGDGHLVESGVFTGKKADEVKKDITELVGGRLITKYRLRDWLISRQRYWGPPLPFVFCENCKKKIEDLKISKPYTLYPKPYSQGEIENPGWIAVAEKDLPVKLPFVKDFRPTGTGMSPLASAKKFYEVKCPRCGAKARRETDVSDTFVDSAWYYIGYLLKADAKGWKSKKIGIKKTVLKKWLPVAMYTGGAEHSVLHLLYTRFVAKALADWGLVGFREPFSKFRAHGLIIKDGAKMSKSKGNVINPDAYIKEFGADVLRTYLMFLGPFEYGGDFRDEGILGIARFLERVWKFQDRLSSAPKRSEESVERALHKAIKKVGDDIAALHYNTAVSALMILLNAFEAAPEKVSRGDFGALLKLLNPFAPHIAHELWASMGNKTTLDLEVWPKYDPKLLEEATFQLIVQVNGKMRDTIEAPKGISQAEALALARSAPNAARHIVGEPKKVIFVPDRLINIVC